MIDFSAIFDESPFVHLNHAADMYARDVLANRILACRFVKLACHRHLADRLRAESGQFRYIFNESLADVRIGFNSLCKHFEGEWGGQPFVPEAWQVFIQSSLYGWVDRETGLRRFKIAYISVARKNGKSFMCGTDGLYLLIMDGEPGAQIVCAATKLDQAAIVHKVSVEIVKASEELGQIVSISKLGRKEIFNLSVESTSSRYKPLGKESKTEDGLNIHGALVDEVHAHPNRGMWDVLETARGARRQPLMIAITTRGFDQTSIGYELDDYAIRTIKGLTDDETFFGIIYTLDLKKDWPDLKTKDEIASGEVGVQEDDWTDERAWLKPNPCLGVSKKLETLREGALKAAQIPASQNNFLTKEMNVWTSQASRWIMLDLWDLNFTDDVYEAA